MAKESFYFSHDYNARNDEKVLELRASFGAEGYGIFWMLIESMAENTNGGVNASLMGGLSVSFGVAKERLIAITEFCISVGLFFEKDGFYFSQRLLEHKAERKFLSDKGKEGAEKRRRNKEKREKEAGANRGAIGDTNSEGNTKERKVKESKEDIVTSTYNPPIQRQFANQGVVHDMIGVWEKYIPDHTEDENEYPIVLKIAYKIAKDNDWKKDDVVNAKRKEIVEIWEKYVRFIQNDYHYSRLQISSIHTQWNGLKQTIAAEKKKREELAQKEKQNVTTTQLPSPLITTVSDTDRNKYRKKPTYVQTYPTL